MYLELPEFRRCCCCLPLRRGIIVFGYINLVIAILMIALEVMVMTTGSSDVSKSVVTMFNGVAFVVQSWVAFLMYAVEAVFNIVLINGAHKKDPQLLKVYSYYGITTALATFVLFVVVTNIYYELGSMWFHLLVIEACFAMTVVGIKLYLLLLIRSELKKLKRHKARRFTTAFEDVNFSFSTI